MDYRMCLIQQLHPIFALIPQFPCKHGPKKNRWVQHETNGSGGWKSYWKQGDWQPVRWDKPRIWLNCNHPPLEVYYWVRHGLPVYNILLVGSYNNIVSDTNMRDSHRFTIYKADTSRPTLGGKPERRIG